ncbi:Rieske 2Fe-2S domain-containing protein [Loktanella agnita]|uniref:Rieske 2Fe-2S domain-containing protein n=1 Tax=Loktanella agnita TaxID=287097 RepID=UPI0039898CA4
MKNTWAAVALSRKLRRKPLKIWFNNTPVVLFRTATGVQALHDRCPHRFAALSDGWVAGDTIACPYHGWQFGGSGLCQAIPGHTGSLPTIRTKSYTATEAGGVIFIADGPPDTAPHTHPVKQDDIIIQHATNASNSTLLDTAENILDATHTHYIHKGFLRGLNSTRFQVQVAVTGGDDWVEACYTGEEQQQGIVTKLLEGTRVKTIGRFRAPGIVELEYWGENGITLGAAFHLRQSRPGQVDGIGFTVGPRDHGLGHLKGWLFKPFLHIGMHQDRKILKSSYEYSQLHPDMKPVIGPLDFLREDIARIIAGERPRAADTPQSLVMEL